MADETRHVADDEEFEVPEDESERGVADDEDEFEDGDELTDEEDDDEDLDAEKGTGDDRKFTSEIGSEGGSQGDMDSERRKPQVTGGSEASTMARTDEPPPVDDRHAAGGAGEPRR